ncbi:T9SS type A sorting domain-containing protein [Hymenobacter elongatus]|uniref:T9SS type A sorting domain-containing protein n=1 Tax=Hymenobacter elongatus TaxID=877208 RepID=A0A4Z0PNI4_9BACT|nr:T9SS type A sorting domain-containing protein [Hymenobacter elongatus]TGE18637.1 T9SS type A sorting domain-containing protein [Hymenobacter elongatus]
MKPTPTAQRLLLASFFLVPTLGWSQSFLQQTFEVNGNSNPNGTRTQLVYSNVGGQTYTGTFAAATTAQNTNAAPITAPVYSEGVTAFGAVNNQGNGLVTSTLTFDPVTFTATSGNYLTFRLVSYQTNGNGGIDNTATNNGVTVSIAYNGSQSYIPTLRVVGLNGGSVFGYSGTGTATTGAPINTTTPSLTTVTSPTDLTGNGQTVALTGTAGLSNVSLRFGAAITSIQVQITLNSIGKTALFIDDVRIGSDGPLPVELTSFEAARQTGVVLLKWATASEKNNDRFEVQRSADGQQFVTISTVQGSGTTTTGNSYTSKDAEPLSDVSYYRLQQVDQDGTVSYSPVRVINAVVAAAYPSPTYDLLNLPASAVGSSYRVFNALGQTLLEGKVSATGAVNVQRLVPGSYFLEVGTGKNQVSQRFIRQ